MRTFVAHSLEEFLSQPMLDLNKQVYRGLSDASFRLIPSIGRVEANTLEALTRFERHIFAEFKRRAIPHLPRPPSTDLEWLFLAQHYRLPTRLLDWTTNPLVALFFAARGSSPADFAVYRVMPLKWIEPSRYTDPFELNEVVAMHPPHLDQRYVVQDGLFTIHPDPRLDYIPPNLDKIVFPGSVREDVQWQLRRIGFSSSRMFPGLEGLAEDLVHEADFHLAKGLIRTKASSGEL